MALPTIQPYTSGASKSSASLPESPFTWMPSVGSCPSLRHRFCMQTEQHVHAMSHICLRCQLVCFMTILFRQNIILFCACDATVFLLSLPHNTTCFEQGYAVQVLGKQACAAACLPALPAAPKLQHDVAFATREAIPAAALQERRCEQHAWLVHAAPTLLLFALAPVMMQHCHDWYWAAPSLRTVSHA